MPLHPEIMFPRKRVVTIVPLTLDKFTIHVFPLPKQWTYQQKPVPVKKRCKVRGVHAYGGCVVRVMPGNLPPPILRGRSGLNETNVLLVPFPSCLGNWVHLDIPALLIHCERWWNNATTHGSSAAVTHLRKLVVDRPARRRSVGLCPLRDLDSDRCEATFRVSERAIVPEGHARSRRAILGTTLPDACTGVQRGHKRIRVDYPPVVISPVGHSCTRVIIVPLLRMSALNNVKCAR